MNSNGVVYRCNKSCPIGKRCFILKTAAMLEEPITVWHKCVAKKEIFRSQSVESHHLNALRK